MPIENGKDANVLRSVGQRIPVPHLPGGRRTATLTPPETGIADPTVIGPTKEEAEKGFAPGKFRRFVESLARRWARPVSIGTAVGIGATVGYAVYDNVGTETAAWWDSVLQDKANNQFLKERPLGPKQSENAVSWWKELPEEQIKNLASLPDIHQIGDKYVSTVTPTLQERAKQAGYKLIYQGDPNDTVGRSVVTKNRQTANKDWTIEDQGFGNAGTTVRGIFKAWVPGLKDPAQKDYIYALLADPISKKEFLVRLELKPFDPSEDVRPTWLRIDNLDNGPSQIERRSKEVGRQPGQELAAEGLPSPTDPSLEQSKKLTDFPTLNDLLRRRGLDPTDLAMPGDYVKIDLQTAGVDYTKGIYTYKVDENGVSRALALTIRRFDGSRQWEAEINK